MDEKESVEFEETILAMARRADSRSGFLSAFGEDFADAQNGSFSVGG